MTQQRKKANSSDCIKIPFEPALASCREVAMMLNTSERQVQRWIEAGQFGPQPTQIGSGKRLWSVAEIRMWSIYGCPNAEIWSREWPKLRERAERFVFNRGGRIAS